MKTVYDFYKSDLQPVLIEQERKRKRVLSVIKFCFAFLIIGAGVSIFNDYRNFGFRSIYGSVMLQINIFSIALVSRIFYMRSYKKSVKQAIIGKAIQLVGPDLQYEARASVPLAEIDESGFFSTKADIKGEDLIQGSLKDLPFMCSEIGVRRLLRVKNKHFYGDNNAAQSYIFRGLFASVELPKTAKSDIYIFPKKLGNDFKNHFKNFTSMGQDKLKTLNLEDPEFERHFNVYASDQIHSRVLLTTKLLENIVRLREKMDVAIYLSIKNNKLCIAVPSSKRLFNVDVSKNYVNPEFTRIYLRELNIVTELIEDIHKLFRVDTNEFGLSNMDKEVRDYLKPHMGNPVVTNLETENLSDGEFYIP